MTKYCQVGKAHLLCNKSSAYGFGASDSEGSAQSSQSVDGILKTKHLAGHNQRVAYTIKVVVVMVNHQKQPQLWCYPFTLWSVQSPYGHG